MKKIVGYKMCWNEAVHRLTIDVNKAIKNGWQPVGSPFVLTGDEGSLLTADEDDPYLSATDLPIIIQAMVKYSND